MNINKAINIIEEPGKDVGPNRVLNSECNFWVIRFKDLFIFDEVTQ
jgi:hypothetical protein